MANELIVSGVYACGYEILYLNCSNFAESYKELDFWVENLAGLFLLLTPGAHLSLAYQHTLIANFFRLALKVLFTPSAHVNVSHLNVFSLHPFVNIANSKHMSHLSQHSVLKDEYIQIWLIIWLAAETVR